MEDVDASLIDSGSLDVFVWGGLFAVAVFCFGMFVMWLITENRKHDG